MYLGDKKTLLLLLAIDLKISQTFHCADLGLRRWRCRLIQSVTTRQEEVSQQDM